jgi:hypothetical protein
VDRAAGNGICGVGALAAGNGTWGVGAAEVGIRGPVGTRGVPPTGGGVPKAGIVGWEGVRPPTGTSPAFESALADGVAPYGSAPQLAHFAVPGLLTSSQLGQTTSSVVSRSWDIASRRC